MKETEVEIEIKHLAPVRKRLESIGVLVEKALFRDVYFDKKMFLKGARVRLRERKVRYPHKKYEAKLTLKKPRIKGGIQRSEELEVRLDDFKTMYKILERLYGPPYFDEVLSVERYKVGSSVVDLRAVKGLFKYVEIEGNTKQIKRLEKRLGIVGKRITEGAFKRICKMRGLL
ncbi:MAG: hypothetical protein J7K68_04100 [Candidatus Diapherotrites archaeon]|nr:hypothetical protein [Candidatus Diapherotrites archaeon]